MRTRERAHCARSVFPFIKKKKKKCTLKAHLMHNILSHDQVTNVFTLGTRMVCVTINTPTDNASRMKIMLKATHPPPTGTAANFPSRWSGRRVVGVHDPEKSSKYGPICQQQIQSKWKYPGTGVTPGKYLKGKLFYTRSESTERRQPYSTHARE